MTSTTELAALPRTPDEASPAPCILVVDDQEMVRTLLDVALRRYGFDVLSADGGAAAVRLFAEHRQRISCVLLDVRMPGQDGPQTLRALRRLDPSVVCCFMTGHAGEHSGEELLALGAARLFDKPFRIDDMVRALRDLVHAA